MSGDSSGAQNSLTVPRLGTSAYVRETLTAEYTAEFNRPFSERQVDAHYLITVRAFQLNLSRCATDLIQYSFAAVRAKLYDFHFVIHYSTLLININEIPGVIQIIMLDYAISYFNF